jgi:hypothetical protein
MICSICQQPLSAKNCHDVFTIRYGNNAQPVNDGICCDDCNWKVVIRARIAAVIAEEAKERPNL